jgi:nitroreductase
MEIPVGNDNETAANHDAPNHDVTNDLTIISSIIRSRRTHMFVDRDREVPHELVVSMCDAAQWAPNHKRTWPWRFALVEHEGRATLGETIAAAMQRNGGPSEKIEKTKTKYLRTPATLVIGSAVGESDLRTSENRDATAAGVQNALLTATAAGLATYWGSCPEGAHEAVSDLCGFESTTYICALIYLGWPISSAEVPPRPDVELHLVR